MQATIVFQQNWDAIHLMAFNKDGLPKLDEKGNHERRYRYIINRGSSRSSKTISLIDCYDLYARQNKSKRLTVWRDTKSDCKKTVLKDAFKHLKRTDRYMIRQRFNITDSIFTYLDTDSTFEIHGTDDEETVHGLEQDAAWFNEPYKISRETFDQIDQRTSDFIFIDYNPKKGHWIEDLMKDPRALVIDSTFRDNPFCPVEQKTKILSYQTVSMCQVVELEKLTINEAFEYDLEGNPNEYTDKEIKELLRCRENEDKNSASEFNWSVYGLGIKSERPNRIFSWKSISLMDYQAIDAKIYIGTDWGKVDPWGIAEVKYYDGALYARELNYLSENEIRSKMSQTEQIQAAGEEEGIVTFMFYKLGIEKDKTVIADNNRPLKISMLRRHGWDAHAANKPKGSIIDGIDLLHNLQVFYTNDSENLEYEQENYSYRVDRHGVVLEEPEDLNNHIIDLIRYVALHLQRMGIIRLI